MKYLLILFIILFTGCQETTTYKAKSLGWSKFLEAKTIVYADETCKNHLGYYDSTQFEQWSGYNNGNFNEYVSVKIKCYDGYEQEVFIQEINNVISPKVSEILKSKDK